MGFCLTSEIEWDILVGMKTTTQTIRSGFEKEGAWTYAEAARYAGLSYQTVRRYLADGRFGIGNVVGPFKVDRDSFIEFVKSGTPV